MANNEHSRLNCSVVSDMDLDAAALATSDIVAAYWKQRGLQEAATENNTNNE